MSACDCGANGPHHHPACAVHDPLRDDVQRLLDVALEQRDQARKLILEARTRLIDATQCADPDRSLLDLCADLEAEADQQFTRREVAEAKAIVRAELVDAAVAWRHSTALSRWDACQAWDRMVLAIDVEQRRREEEGP